MDTKDLLIHLGKQIKEEMWEKIVEGTQGGCYDNHNFEYWWSKGFDAGVVSVAAMIDAVREMYVESKKNEASIDKGNPEEYDG